MNIKIHREAQHSYPIIEISTDTTKILLDKGTNLDENGVFLLADMKNIYDFGTVNGIFHTQFHADHITAVPTLLEGVPVYAGKLSSNITTAAQAYKAKKPLAYHAYYKDQTPIVVGDITVTPYSVDDEKYDGYLFDYIRK